MRPGRPIQGRPHDASIGATDCRPPVRRAAQRGRRRRTAPRATEGSTARPCWVITMAPAATSRFAAARTVGMAARQSALAVRAASSRAASLGQIEAPRARTASSSRIACSAAASTGPGGWRRQRSEQYFTDDQLRAQRGRQAMVRPQAAQALVAPGPPPSFPESRLTCRPSDGGPGRIPATRCRPPVSVPRTGPAASAC